MRLAHIDEESAWLLEAFAVQLTAQDVVLPARTYVSSGEIAWDTPALTINLGAISSGEPHRGIDPLARVPASQHFSIALTVQLSRGQAYAQAVGGTTPKPTEKSLNADGQQALSDASNLVIAAVEVWKQYKVVYHGQTFAIGPVTPLGPRGGMAAMALRLDFSLN